MQFQVPQFIETEDKVVGPLTLRQFMYIAGAGAASAGLSAPILGRPAAANSDRDSDCEPAAAADC